jgi:hypothetical protein
MSRQYIVSRFRSVFGVVASTVLEGTEIESPTRDQPVVEAEVLVSVIE